MHKITKFGYLLVCCLTLLFLFMPTLLEAQSDVSQQNSDAVDVKETKKVIEIGLLQFMDHPALDQIRAGIYDGLAERGYVDGKNIKIDYKNGQADQSNLKMLSDNFVTEDKDLLVGIATPAAQSLMNAAQGKIPVVLGAISDPVGSGLIKNEERPGVNATGTADVSPVKDQFDLITSLLPDIKTIGIIYNSSETNVEQTVTQAKAEASKRGIAVKIGTISSTNDLAQVTEQLANQTDAIYVPNDNTIAGSMNTLIDVTDAHQIPVFPSVDTMVQDGGLATVGLNQHQFGLDTGTVIADIIEGADPAEYPILETTKMEKIVNFEKAEELGITIPENIRSEAKDVKEMAGE